MGYCGCMGYEAVFPVNQLGGLKNVWNLREYGVCEPWVTRESTVLHRAFLAFPMISTTKLKQCFHWEWQAHDVFTFHIQPSSLLLPQQLPPSA